jgi:hypothetical protein
MALAPLWGLWQHNSVWRKWDIGAWGERLLEHFFGRYPGGEPGPVEILLVTAEEIAAGTGDASADPREAKANFLSAMMAEIGDLSVMDHAFKAVWSPQAPEIIPPVFAHLMLSCLAASESSDELADEGSFIRRLEFMTRDRFGRLEHLPRHWERFSEWLSAGRNPLRYRQLILPDPRHLARIGYTVNLAFPDRRDQRALSALLHSNSISASHPPVGRIMRLISAHRQDFKPRFLEAFDDFRARANNGGGSEIHRHRCWAAIMAALIRGRRESGGAAIERSRISLIGWLSDDEASFCMGAEKPIDQKEFTSWPLPVPFGAFRHVVTVSGASRLDEAAILSGVCGLLEGKLRVPALHGAVMEGLIPLGVSSGSHFEFQSPDETETPTMALVRSDLVPDAKRLFGGHQLAGPCPGWSVLAGCKIRPLSAATSEHEPLGRCWSIHATPSRPKLRVSGGIRVDDGWLADPRLLPSVRILGATEILISDGIVDRSLVELNDSWKLPSGISAGTWTVTAFREGQLIDVKTIRLHAVPAAEDYLPPSEPAAWLTENSHGSERLSDCELAASPETADTSQLTELRAYLGPDVGEFRVGAEGAAWTATRQSGQVLVSRADHNLAGRAPTRQNEDKGANRRWRKILGSTAPSDDPEFAATRAAIWQAANSRLPKVRFESAPGLLEYDPPTATPHPELPSLVAAVAARSACTSGIPLAEFYELTGLVMQLDSDATHRLTRAWLEAGFVDLACFARWGGRRIYARQPALVAYREGSSHVATLEGLALWRTRQRIREAAERLALAVWEKGGLGPFTPAVPCVRSTKAEDLQSLAAECCLPLRWVGPDIWRLLGRPIIEIGSEPGGYGHQRDLSAWRVDGVAQPEALLTAFYRPDAPKFWRVRVGDQQRWSYALNPVRLAACAMLRLPPCTPRGSHELAATRAYLPLPLARFVAILGPALPGALAAPAGSPHLYSFNTERFRMLVEASLGNIVASPASYNGDHTCA